MRVNNRRIGVSVPGLREFVPANWTIPENPFFPGMAGLREFVPARFTVPPQPAGIGRLRRGTGDFVPARFSLPPQPAGIGDFVGTPYMYPIPQNSVIVDAGSVNYQGGLTIPSSAINTGGMTFVDPGAGVPGLGCARGSGHECAGCKSGHGCGGGLGQAMTDFGNTFTNLTSGNTSGAWTSFMAFLEDPAIGTVPVWMVGGGALLVWALFFSGGDHSRYSRGKKASAAARRAYA
jgi:hypothetical protein